MLLERSHSHADGRFVGLGVYSENALTSFSGWLLSLGFDLYTSSNQNLRGKACQVDRGVAVPGGLTHKLCCNDHAASPKERAVLTPPF